MRTLRGTALTSLGWTCLVAAVGLGALPAVASASSAGVTQIRLAHVSANISAGRTTGTYVAVDPGSDTIAATGTVGATNETAISDSRVWLVSGRTHKLAHTVELPGAYVSSIADDSATGTFYVADPYVTVAPDITAGGVAVISAKTGKLTDEIPLPGVSSGVGVDLKTGEVIVTGPGYGITVINGHARTVIGPLGAGDIAYPAYVGIDSASDIAYIGGGASGGVDGIWFVNLSTGQLFGVPTPHPVNVETLDPPNAIATDPATHRTYAALEDSKGAGLATIKGTSDSASTKELKNGNSADGVAVDTKSDVIYVSTANQIADCPDFVDEISGRTGKVIGAVHNLGSATSIAVDPNSDMVYVQDGGVLDAFSGGLTNKQKKCGTPGTVIGAERR